MGKIDDKKTYIKKRVYSLYSYYIYDFVRLFTQKLCSCRKLCTLNNSHRSHSPESQ